MAGIAGKVKGGLGRAKKLAGNAVSIFTKLRYHYGWHYKYSPIRENAILFESFHGKTMSDSPLHMLRAFLDDPRSEGFDVYYTTTLKNLDAHRALAQSLGLDVEFVVIESWKYVKILATAKYLVNNSSFPAFFTRRPEQHYIQTWHGTPLKTLGKQMRQGIESMYNVQHNFLQASMLTFPNEFTRDVLMRDYNLVDLYTGKTALLGYPRNGVFFDKAKAAEIKRRHGLQNMETFAYMPTWRGANNYTVDVRNYRDEVMSYLRAVDAVLEDDQAMFVNFHSMVASKITLDSFKHVFPFPADEDNYEFLNAMDVLVTDYSSVFFDYSLTRKPIVLFIYDKDAYLSERGMYMDIEELPFPKARTIEELTDIIRSKAYREASYEQTDYEREFLSYDSPANATRALDLLFDEEAEGVSVFDHASNGGRQWLTIDPICQQTVADIRTACEAADPKRDIVMFSRASFNEDKSQLLHDDYRDNFNFVFITKAYTCTALEEILAKRTENAHAKLVERERQRLFPNLCVSLDSKRNLYVGEEGTSCVWEEGTLAPLEAGVESDGHTLTLTVAKSAVEGFGRLAGIAAVRDRNVMWHRTLTHDESESGVIVDDFEPLRQQASFKRGMEVGVYLECLDAQGNLVPHPVRPNKKRKLYSDDALRGLMIPMRYVSERTGKKEVLLPRQAAGRALTLYHGANFEYLSAFKHAKLRKLITKGNCAYVLIDVREGDFILEDVVLRLRSKTESVEIALPYTLTHEEGWLRIETFIDPELYEFQEIYWDLFVVIHRFGSRGLIPVKLSNAQRRALYIGNKQWRIGQDKVLFAHIAKGSYLAFVYRDYYPKLDTPLLRLKEFTAIGAYLIARPYWKKKRVWLVFEKFCKLAQDNGYYFFDYCMGLPEAERKHVYYIIDKSQPDYANVAAHNSQVINFMSVKHILYALASDMYIGSDSKSHLYVWRPKPTFLRRFMRDHKIFFLQHGVTALKQVDHLFGMNGSSPMSYFLTTSEREQQIVVNNFDYQINQAPVLGFSRWDVLEDRSSKDSPSILLMPTWRPWLEEQGDELFVKSEYFKTYSSLIQSQELAEVLERHNATLRFFIHPKLSERLSNFTPASKRIQLVPQGSEPLNFIMMECNMLITDYSSVCWDMLFMDKPVVFYQFDQDLYEEVVGSYVNLNEDLPGDVCIDEQSLVAAVDACVQREFILKEEHAAKAESWFAYRDSNNRQRTYNFIVEKGF